MLYCPCQNKIKYCLAISISTNKIEMSEFMTIFRKIPNERNILVGCKN